MQSASAALKVLNSSRMQGHWKVTDLSRNGTMINGAKLGKDNSKQLKGGEEITVSLATPGDNSTWVK